MRPRARLLVPLLAAAMLLVGIAPAGAAPDDAARADQAIAWLRSQLHDGLLEQFEDTPDYGLTLDMVLGLRAAGEGPEDVRPILEAMGGITDFHLEYDGSITSGLVGKALVTAHVSHYPIHDFHGVDLLEMAEASVHDSGKVQGGPHDPVNLFSQTWVMMGLTQQGRLPEATVDFLADQQCSAGYFRMYYTDGLTCDEAGSSYDVDGTVLALFALEAALEAGFDEAAAPLERGRAWLVGHQQPSGGFDGSVSTPVENSNSTALAVAALHEHDRAAAERAAAWVKGLAYDAGPDEGAVAFVLTQREEWTPGAALSGAERGGAIRATPQAILAFAPTNYAFIAAPGGDPAPAPSPPDRQPPAVRPGLPPTGG